MRDTNHVKVWLVVWVRLLVLSGTADGEECQTRPSGTSKHQQIPEISTVNHIGEV